MYVIIYFPNDGWERLKNTRAHTITILFLRKVWKNEYGNIYIILEGKKIKEHVWMSIYLLHNSL